MKTHTYSSSLILKNLHLHSVSNVTLSDLHEIKKKKKKVLCSLACLLQDVNIENFTGIGTASWIKTAPNLPSPKPEENIYDSWKAWWGLCLLAFLLLSSLAAAKWSSLSVRWGTLTPGMLPGWTRPRQSCAAQSGCSTLHPKSPALADSQPAFHGIHFRRSLAASRGETCPFGFLCQKKCGYSQCATRLSKVKTKILWKYRL